MYLFDRLLRRMSGRKGGKVAINVPYDGAHGYVTNRPYADIFCHGVSGRIAKPFHLSALIDTGADYLELPTTVATSVGVNLYHYPTHKVITAGGGSASVVVVNNFSVDVEGKLVTVTAHFSEREHRAPGIACDTRGGRFRFGYESMAI
jgi:hypothetical protein